ncbi:hypothetical protein SAMN05192533_10854 [Mesobacillus persicus]|uniref:DUF1287 domain-containing protein n=1 Tax=Mesobacillus persicus TaxID=930146 RepID=A0A1H8D325_9BACI|nr:hypothetical protein SAMN05192533_10854 [Mesobacillus persicus]
MNGCFYSRIRARFPDVIRKKHCSFCVLVPKRTRSHRLLGLSIFVYVFRNGVCTDVIWRGLAGAGINLKDLMDLDIKEHTSLYPRVAGKPDPHIDFRRVPNQYVFFQRFTESLTTELIPNDPKNLAEWQPGDIVIYLEGTDHAGIISDRRTKDGIPYLIHNTPPFASEIKLTSYKQPIAGHYRWKY